MRSVFKYLLLFVLITSMLFLIGCAESYSRNDVNKYIKNEIGIKGYELADKMEEISGDDGIADQYWHVKYEDIEFDVIDNWNYGMAQWSSHLEDNFQEKVIDYYYNLYKDKYKIQITNSYAYNHVNEIVCKIADEDKNYNTNDLKEYYEDVKSFLETIDLKKYPLKTIQVAVVNSRLHAGWHTIYENNKFNSFEKFSERTSKKN